MTSTSLPTVVRNSIRSVVFALLLCANSRAAGGSDSCATPEPITGFGGFNILLTGATNSPELASEPPCGDIAQDVWFEWTAPSTDFARVSFGQYLVRVYAGSGCPTAGSLIHCSSQTSFLANAGATYIIRIGVAAGGPPVSAGGQFTIENVTAAGDSCAAPVMLTGWRFFTTTENHFTSAEGQNDPACAGAGGSGVLEDGWYRWTSPYTGNVRADCCITTVATGDWKAAVYLGGSCPSGPPIACDDNSCGAMGLQPVLTFAAVLGQTYLFQVGRSPGYASTAPLMASFGIGPTDVPPNDDCTSPTQIQGSGPFAYTLGTTNLWPMAYCSQGEGDVWFRWTPPATGTATFDGCSANFDQLVEVYFANWCPSLPQFIHCEDEGCGGVGPGPARLTFSATCGSPYLFRISARVDDPPLPPWFSLITTQGSFTLTVAATPCYTFSLFCAGDQPSSCPCANSGVAGHGCANSFSNQGGQIYGMGSASLANDTVSLFVGGVSPSLVTLFQGTSQAGGGAGIWFGDGLLCVGGTLTRLVARIANGGQLTYPGPGDTAVSVLGMVQAASTRDYQAWYRDASLAYCTPETFNLTNGLEVTWLP